MGDEVFVMRPVLDYGEGHGESGVALHALVEGVNDLGDAFAPDGFSGCLHSDDSVHEMS